MTYRQSNIAEYDFLRYMTEETGCQLLLDVNNIYVSAYNNDFDPADYIRKIPHESVVQMHLAGHRDCGDYIIDTHDNYVTPEVWELFTLAWQLTGGAATLLEWDANIPDFEEYHAELLKAKDFMSDFAGAAFEKSLEFHEPGVSNPVDFLVPEYEFTN